MAINYPSSIDNGTSLPNPSATNDTNSPSLSSGQVLQNDAVIALETKVGINSSVAAANQVLLGTGTGASTWGPLTSAYVGSGTGSGNFVFATSPTITGATLTAPTINNPTLNTDSVVGFTSANNGTLYGISVTASAFTSSSAFGPGIILPSALESGTGSSWTWQSWTPTWTNFTIGNATQTAKYIQIGKTVNFTINLQLGSSSVMSTGPIFTLPVTAVFGSFYEPKGTILMAHDGSSVVFTGIMVINGTNAGLPIPNGVSGSLVEFSTITSTNPFTWTNGSFLQIQGTYQAA